MNYGAYYPPGSNYGVASAYNRAYPAANSYTPTGSNYGQQATSGASNGKASASNNGNDQSFITGMQNMSLASK